MSEVHTDDSGEATCETLHLQHPMSDGLWKFMLRRDLPTGHWQLVKAERQDA